MMEVKELEKQLGWEPTMVSAPRPEDWGAWAQGEPTPIIHDESSAVLLRDGEVLSRVSNKYHPFRNADMIGLTKAALSEGWQLDSCLEFNGGRSVVVNLVDEESIGGFPDDHSSLVALVNSFTGKEALRLLPVDRRIFCRNQLPYYSGQRSYRHPHSKHAEFPSGVFASIRADLQHRQVQMERFKDVKVNFQEFVEQLITTSLGQDADEVIKKKRRDQFNVAYYAPTAPEKSGTAYAALQAVILADQKIIGRRGWRTVYGSELSQLALEICESELVSSR